jgi:hypothetical protein
MISEQNLSGSAHCFAKSGTHYSKQPFVAT